MVTAKERNLLIVKYALFVLIALNILNSIWVIIYDYNLVQRVRDELPPEDWTTNEKTDSYYAMNWFAACVFIMIVNDLLSGVALFGVYQESSQIVMIYSELMFIIAVYGAWDKYMKGSVTVFLFPLITGIVSILYASLNYIRLFDGSPLPEVTYVTKSNATATQLNHQGSKDETELLKTETEQV